MKTIKLKMKIVIFIILLLVFLQLYRVGYFIRFNDFSNTIKNDYENIEKSNFDHNELIGYKKQSCLFIPSGDEILNDDIIILLNYLKLDYNVRNLINEDLSKYDFIIVSEHEFENVKDFDKIMSYVHLGGKLILNVDENFYSTDIYNKYKKEICVIEKKGMLNINKLKFNVPLIIGVDSVFKFDENMSYVPVTSSKIKLSSKAEVLLSGNDNPLIWKTKFGEGKIAIVNASFSDLSLNRAILLGVIQEINTNFIYPIINAEVIFIDDFPGKFVGNNEKVKKEYGINIKRFLSDIWWPDIVTTIANYGVKYTCAFIASYNDNVTEEFDKEELIDKNVMLTYGREIFKVGGEIAFHGYNHQPLIFDKKISSKFRYKAWPSLNAVENALLTAKKYFENIFPNYKWRSYIPPSNLLDEDMIPILLKSIPTLEVFSGVMFSSDEGSLSQEFGVYQNGVVKFPRVSAGSIVKGNELLNVKSVLSVNGVISHFIHPDDFMSDDRSYGLTWEKLFEEYENFLADVNTSYPWIEKLTVIEASEKVRQYTNIEIFKKIENNKISIKCNNFVKNQSLIISLDKKIISSEGCSFEEIGNNKYILEMHESTTVLEVL